ncbi:MAG TPA: SpoIIE family protein phosphatase [Nocardioides sp.]|nr:SpoIIE family protein phosphatase [Nocardioides sp.]
MPDILARAGSLRPAYDAVDWAATPLGPIREWGPTLRNAVDLALGTRFPMTLLWGPEFTLVYNAAYVELIGDKHPDALGAPARSVFPEAWEQIGPMMEAVYAGEGATWVVDELVPLRRSGFLEDCWFTFSYSAVRGPAGLIEGVMDIAAETTTRVVVGRRLQLLARLGVCLSEVADLASLHAATLECLAADPYDLAEVDLVLDPATAGALAPAWTEIRVPLADRHAAAPVLRVRPAAGLRRDQDFYDFLDLLADAVGRTVDRLVATEAERSLSTVLQLSLLTEPVSCPGLDIAVRYVPAVEAAQVGGDWYDSFVLPDGAVGLVVGDVAGHDENAAAAMAQLRNLTRGVAYSLRTSPAAVLTGVDGALAGLGADMVATAILVEVADDGAGRVRARWSNAGHPPPVLVTPDGGARLLEGKPDLLLGLDPGTERTDHEVVLESGSALVLYTDGLVERRGASLDDGLAWLVGAVSRSGADSEGLCTLLIDEVHGEAEDDVALLVLRVT